MIKSSDSEQVGRKTEGLGHISASIRVQQVGKKNKECMRYIVKFFLVCLMTQQKCDSLLQFQNMQNSWKSFVDEHWQFSKQTAHLSMKRFFCPCFHCYKKLGPFYSHLRYRSRY